MSDIQKKEFFELMEEIKSIADKGMWTVGDKIWKIQLQFSSIRELLRKAEIILKDGFVDEETE